MTERTGGHIAIVYPGDHAARQQATPKNNRLATVFQALTHVGLHAEPAVYHDDFCDDVYRQLLRVDAVLVWVNPIQDGRDRSILDAMLRQVADAGIFVSAHPDVILKMGTKEVLYRTRHMGWGSDTHIYRSMAQMCAELPSRLAAGEARVLKQYRGNGGNGVWKVALARKAAADSGMAGSNPIPSPEAVVRVRHAKRGRQEETMMLRDFLERCEAYYRDDGRMVDQAFQTRLPEGMVRCYLVSETVVGFGHQAINALYPAPPGEPPQNAPLPGPRLYHPPDRPAFQRLKHVLENVWVPAMQRLLAIDNESLPILWDCDFLLGPKDVLGQDTYVLCEINVSSVAPFPESALPAIAQATRSRVQTIRQRR